MQPVSTLLTLNTDILLRISHFLPDKKHIDTLTLVCKRMLSLNLYQEWPKLIRERMIRYANNNPLPTSITQYFDAYKNQSSLCPHDGTVFIYRLLKATSIKEASIEDYLEQNTCHLIDREKQASEELINTLLINSEYETAFAYAAVYFKLHFKLYCKNITVLDAKFKYEKPNNHIQHYLASTKGFSNALALTSSFTDGRVRSIALPAFINYGMTLVDPQHHEFQHHAFTQALLHAKNLPVSAIHLLLEKIICPLEECIHRKNHLSDLLTKLYKLIPDEYEFADEDLLDSTCHNHEGDLQRLSEIYFDRLYDGKSLPWQWEGRELVLIKERVEKCIQAVETFPHPGLKKKMASEIVGVLYSDALQRRYSSDKFSMQDFWPIIHRIEKHFGMQDIYVPVLDDDDYHHYFDRATETYMTTMLETSPQDLLTAIKDNAEFSLAVVELLTLYPHWFQVNKLGNSKIYSGIEALLLKHGRQDVATTFSKIHG